MIDIDKLFEDYFKNYLVENAGKFSEEELEDKVGELYEEFGNTPIKELGGKSPVDYFKNMSGKQLVEALEECVDGNIAVSDFLCDAIENSGEASEYLVENVSPNVSDELATYSLNLLNAIGLFNEETLNKFVDIIYGGEAKESLTEALTETLASYADEVKEKILSVYDESDFNKKYFIEILSETTPKDERVLNILIDDLLSGEHVALSASYLTKYGDDGALPALKELASKTDNYLDYKELKLAVEALGGEVEEERDFSSDALYKKIKFSN